jgi:hypothetical protein
MAHRYIVCETTSERGANARRHHFDIRVEPGEVEMTLEEMLGPPG